MSKTELEEDLRATFERAAASVPLAPDLADRATSGARKAQRRTWIVSGAAAAAVAAIATVGFSLNGPAPSSPTPAAGNPTTSATVSPSAPVLSAQTVAGTWRPVQMRGFATLKAARPVEPNITFRADGTWRGSDGCNGIGGAFTVGQRGEFSATSGPQHMVGCDNVPHTEILQTAKRITIDQTALRFFGPDGREVARYARTR
ncbi:hypothetical protein GCM10009789_85120 [Kribbella sancticallisti]|uniref:DUF306 domain-containing protein n=1 Tax=Kribbella sancticallisti TaxID=460087 RepID=A0ABN2EUB1_9ACTN